ncbi:response regulator transcription factor [Halalkalibacter sp. APA_J-10(15)]|uniref:response regulator transcription factor n=1 Tax=Halalkalibacter sp. APA_J-10(15) TaxID=2933805 RepID=UPI001FF3CAB5|nr:response regulator transcription factor [Halalkalibacter sp. APA_J-10(15)]MCK0470152.1 response regulator transcription factor [Halalkalibacter sp. APA_J-10(15)]
MLNVLLVDDEPLILEGLQALIDWESLGYTIIGTAFSAEEALLKYSDEACDLVITDIRMSNRNGLILISKWQELQPKTKWVVLSGYEDFNYVRQGLVLGIENYLVKPVNEKELISTLEQVKKKIYSSKHYTLNKFILRDNAIWQFLHGEMEKLDFEGRMELSNVQISLPFTKLTLLTIPNHSAGEVSSIQKQLEFKFKKKGLVCCCTPEDDLLILIQGVHIQMKDLQYAIVTLMSEQIQKPFILYMGDECTSDSELKKCLKYAKQHRERYAFFNETRIVYDTDWKETEEEFIRIEPLLKLINEAKLDQAKLWVESNLLSKRYHKTQIKSGAVEAVIAINTLTSAVERSTIAELLDDIMNSTTKKELAQHMYSVLENVILHVMRSKDVNHSLIHDVVDYLHNGGYKEEVSLKVLGQKFYINSIYLGQLFHKEMGISFSEFLNQLRLNKAKELLLMTHKKAGAIGKLVGYADPTYFYKQFKKQCGVTPNEFRSIEKAKKIKQFPLD